MSAKKAFRLAVSEEGARRLEIDDCIVVSKEDMRKAQIGAGVGNFMEWYDIGIYGYLAVTMTSVFTEGMTQSMGLIVTLLGFAVSFVVRPLGGMILGPLGDKIGRQKVLFFTMALMAAATTLIGILPTAGQVGLWVIIPLYLLKMVQGFSTGGEFSGASTYVAEFSPDRSRGLWTSLLNSGSMFGFAAGAGVVALTSMVTTSVWGETAMVDGGWRIPFLIALPLGILAIWFRSRVPETPSFEQEQEDAPADPDSPFARHGVLGIIKHYWPQILIGCALTAADSTAAYALTSYMPTYLETEVGIHAVTVAVVTVIILVLVGLLLPIAAAISDRIGRKPIYAAAIISNIVLIFPAFALMQSGRLWAVYLALGLMALPVTLYLSMTAAALSELFPTASRYGGMGLTHNVAISFFGGTTPLFSQLLINLTGNAYAPAFYIVFFSVLAGFALFKMRESGGRPLLGSVPIVTSRDEAKRLVETQDANPRIDTTTMLLAPLGTSKDRMS